MKYKKINDDLFSEEKNVPIIEKLVRMQDTQDKYILDDENAIIVIKNPNKKSEYYYIMIHERLINGKLQEINRWNMKTYYFGSIHDETVIEDLNLFKVQGVSGNFSSLYNYKKGEFVIPRGEWGMLDFGRNNKNLEKYNGILGVFRLSSSREKSDTISYVNPLTNEKIVETFNVTDGDYYAIINLDGTIRKKKLFKGSSFSKIEEIIDLKQYDSLQQFKEERKRICNQEKNKKKETYYQMLAERNDGSISPYLDTEVMKILKIKKKVN